MLVEPGLRGHRISAGYLVARGNLGQFGSLHATGLALREDDAWRRYAGLALQLQPAFATGVRVSALVPVGSTGLRRLRWIADVALGL